MDEIIFAILTAADLSLVAWVAQNYDKTDTLKLVMSIILIGVITGGIVWVNKAAYRRINKLEDL